MNCDLGSFSGSDLIHDINEHDFNKESIYTITEVSESNQSSKKTIILSNK